MNFLSGNLTSVEFLGTLNKSVSTLAAFAFIGSLLATSFLLPEREGSFEKGENILIVDENEKSLARGLSSFTSSEINKIKGAGEQINCRRRCLRGEV